MSDVNEAKILWDNCQYNGIDLTGYYEFTGSEIARKIVTKLGKTKVYTVLCGLGGNGVDGLSISYFLHKQGVKNLTVLICGKQIENPLSDKFIKDLTIEGVEIINDATVKEISKTDIFIEALIGTGLEGDKLNKRFKDIIQKIRHVPAKIIAIDNSVPGYNPDFTYSILYPKNSNAETVEYNLPAEIMTFCGPGEFNALKKPNSITHTSNNGKVLYFSNDQKGLEKIYKGCESYGSKLMNFSFTERNLKLQRIDVLENEELEDGLSEADTYLFGDIEMNYITDSVISRILVEHFEKNFVFFGNSLSFLTTVNLKNLGNSVMILNRIELNALIKKSPSLKLTEGILRRFAVENNTNVVLIGSSTIMYNSSGEMKVVYSNEGMSPSYIPKLASLIASYSTKNDFWLSIRAASFA